MKIFVPLASGSKGNCTYLEMGMFKCLIDIGASRHYIVERLRSLSVSPEEIQGILISHEHTDHVSGLRNFIKTYRTPIICNLATARALRNLSDLEPKFHIFVTGTTFTLGEMTVQTFNVPHDAEDPVGFVFHHQGKKLGFCTDVGQVTSWIAHSLYNCDTLLIESNHDPEMVRQSTRAPIYKERVLSQIGHLSNAECAQLLRKIITPRLKTLYLAHLSNECNTPELALTSALSVLEPLSEVTPVIVGVKGILTEANI